MNKISAKLTVLILMATLIWSCNKKDDPQPIPDPIPPETHTDTTESTASVVNQFIYRELSTYYLWESKVENLNNSEFNKDVTKLDKMLNQYNDPVELFNSLLYKKGKIDKWSFIVDEGEKIDDWISGISESMGYDFQLYWIDTTHTTLVGVVRYVYKDSPAKEAGVKRGDMFTKINGVVLTGTNYQELLFNNKTYTLSLAIPDENGDLVDSGEEYTMTAIELQENPIHLDTVINVSGTKVGYLVYNGFNGAFYNNKGNTFNHELNDVFGKFKEEGVDKFILDLRYNSGGSVLTAMYLASMIYTTNTDMVLAKTQYNSLLQNYFKSNYGPDYFDDTFQDKISGSDDYNVTDPINSLELDEIYIITSKRTASASELLINGLRPYMNVHQVGTATAGKYVGSFTIKDWLDDGSVNPDNKWAMQPITLKIANSEGISDYVDGLEPDIYIEESSRILPFSDLNEPLLRACLEDMGLTNAVASTKSAHRLAQLKSVNMKKFKSPYEDLMYRDDALMKGLPKALKHLKENK